MRNWLRKLEAMAAAVGFAEEGEWETAQGIVQESGLDRKSKVNAVSKRSDQRLRKQSYRV
jgi:hypothetical protein